MTLHIENPEAERLARELAAATGQSVDEAVLAALREKLHELRTKRHVAERVAAIARRVASSPTLDPRTPEEIIGYDERGLPA